MTKEEKKLVEDLEFRIRELERIVRELVEYKEDKLIEQGENIGGVFKNIGIIKHDYKLKD